MQLIEKGRTLKIKTSIITLLFCGVIFITGLYQVYRFIDGQNYDLLGLFLCLSLPILVLGFIYPREILITKDSHLTIKRLFLFRSDKHQYELTQIDGVMLSRGKGDGAASNYGVIVMKGNAVIKSFGLFSKLSKTKDRETVFNFFSDILLR
ncbi:putative membrane protein [Halobacteriovorax marinus SJ]|uniref:Membrane protein n=1 Tax=Halobacteriovorax marinus (strain ATCC BAA-682 / DSM 15412 / SJ) TaxID=862908 RepID=E1WX73_HALMS|nr:hypothetical protein [Halobacteriovorax marinus]CBW25774.1 putative membrane protein [Halobacteriovorax marinus SJ]